MIRNVMRIDLIGKWYTEIFFDRPHPKITDSINVADRSENNLFSSNERVSRLLINVFGGLIRRDNAGGAGIGSKKRKI